MSPWRLNPNLPATTEFTHQIYKLLKFVLICHTVTFKLIQVFKIIVAPSLFKTCNIYGLFFPHLPWFCFEDFPNNTHLVMMCKQKKYSDDYSNKNNILFYMMDFESRTLL